MSRHLFAHVAAMRHQIRRIQRATVLGTAAMLPCAAILLATSEASWLILLLLLVLAGYVQRKVRRVFWARRAVRQLRLEEQFVRHSPTPEHVLRCTRRHNHLWTQSLILKGLKTLGEHKGAPSLPDEGQHEHIRRHYTHAFKTLRPSRLPADLIWFTASGLLWLWFLPEAFLLDMSLLVFVGLALLLFILVAEVVQVILCSDLRDGFAHFTILLSAWTRAHALETVFEAVGEKPYRHTALYRSWIFPRNTRVSDAANAAAPARPLQSLQIEVD